MDMLEYQEQGRRQRLTDGNTRQRVQFSFTVTGAAIALLCLIASADDDLTARAAPATSAVALLSDSGETAFEIGFSRLAH
jgi:hypothetical protein